MYEPLYLPNITKADFYTWSLTDIILTFNGVRVKGALVVLYDEVDGPYYQTSEPFRAEFSWRYEAPSGNNGNQMSYDFNVCKKMMDLLLAITDSVEWFDETPDAEIVY